MFDPMLRRYHPTATPAPSLANINVRKRIPNDFSDDLEIPLVVACTFAWLDLGSAELDLPNSKPAEFSDCDLTGLPEQLPGKTTCFECRISIATDGWIGFDLVLMNPVGKAAGLALKAGDMGSNGSNGAHASKCTWPDIFGLETEYGRLQLTPTSSKHACTNSCQDTTQLSGING